MLRRAWAAIQIGRQMRSCLIAQEIGNDGDAGCAQHLYATPLILGMRIYQRHIDRADPPGDHLFSARGRALMECARLECNKGCHIFQSPAELEQRHGFGMWLIRRLCETTGDYDTVTHEDAPYGWIWQASR